MKVLLDECLPKKLKYEISAEVVRTVPEAGWAGRQNGELPELAEKDFDVLLTNDQNIEHQQKIERFDLALIVIVAPSNDIVDLLPLVQLVNQTLKTIKPGTIEYIKKDDQRTHLRSRKPLSLLPSNPVDRFYSFASFGTKLHQLLLR